MWKTSATDLRPGEILKVLVTEDRIKKSAGPGTTFFFQKNILCPNLVTHQKVDNYTFYS